MRKIILASSSPRRKELLRRIGLQFSICSAHTDETCDRNLAPKQYARAIARHKAVCASYHHSEDLIIAADTIVVLNNEILTKPVDIDDARCMLCRLSGKRHIVITAYTVYDALSNKMRTRAVETFVWFRKLQSREIDAYIRTGEPFDKAGAYGIQAFGALLVKKIEGDYFNVMGLPIASVAQTLREFGIVIL